MDLLGQCREVAAASILLNADSFGLHIGSASGVAIQCSVGYRVPNSNDVDSVSEIKAIVFSNMNAA